MAHGFERAFGHNGTFIHSRGSVAHDCCVHAKDGTQALHIRSSQLSESADAYCFETLCALLADARHDANLHGREKRRLASRIHHGEASGLVEVGGDFGDRLAACYANRARDTQLGDMLLDAHGDCHGVISREASGSDVEKSLIDGDLLEQW